MGFSYQQHTKGVYFDGRERDDVVASRRSYLNTLQSYEKRMWVYTSPCPDPAIHPILRVYHDESTTTPIQISPFIGQMGQSKS